MKITAVTTDLFTPRADLPAFIVRHIPTVKEGIVLAVASKLVCLWKGEILPYESAAQKEELKKSKLSDKNNEWVGNVGDRITVAVKSIRLLYSSSYEVAWHTYADSYTYEIIDNEGHTFILKSSKNLLWNDLFKEEVNLKEIVATIKEHSTYNYVKQTVLTRARITKEGK